MRFLWFCQHFYDCVFTTGISIGFDICSSTPSIQTSWSSSKDGCHGNDRDLLASFTFQLTDCFCCFQFIHDRYHHIHDDKIILTRLEFRNISSASFSVSCFSNNPGALSSSIAWAISILMALSSTSKAHAFPWQIHALWTIILLRIILFQPDALSQMEL